MKDIKRCSWCLRDQLYIDYHDNVWGVAEYDSVRLFEYLNLEGAQAGLSWYTVLKKIEDYRKAFHNWDIERIAKMTDKELEDLKTDSSIIRNRLKIEAVRMNARSYLAMEKEGLDFSEYIWSFVNGSPIVNDFKNLSEIPAQTEISKQLSKDLKKRGFKFVGPTIVYAFMQAVGMVDDHVESCWKRNS